MHSCPICVRLRAAHLRGAGGASSVHHLHSAYSCRRTTACDVVIVGSLDHLQQTVECRAAFLPLHGPCVTFSMCCQAPEGNSGPVLSAVGVNKRTASRTAPGVLCCGCDHACPLCRLVMCLVCAIVACGICGCWSGSLISFSCLFLGAQHLAAGRCVRLRSWVLGVCVCVRTCPCVRTLTS